jgi:hypothetical protein
VLVQVLAGHQPPASCQQAWDEEDKSFTSCEATLLLGELSKVDPDVARRAITAGAVPRLTTMLRLGAQRLEWLDRQGLWDEEAETCSSIGCGTAGARTPCAMPASCWRCCGTLAAASSCKARFSSRARPRC